MQNFLYVIPVWMLRQLHIHHVHYLHLAWYHLLGIYKHLLSDKKYGLTHNLLACKVLPTLVPLTVAPGLNIEQVLASSTHLDRSRTIRLHGKCAHVLLTTCCCVCFSLLRLYRFCERCWTKSRFSDGTKWYWSFPMSTLWKRGDTTYSWSIIMLHNSTVMYVYIITFL